MARVNYKKVGPEGFKAMSDVAAYVMQSGLEEVLIHMIYLRVSQINGCPYCIDLHWRDLVKEGQDPRKINGVIIWRDMPFFSERERAALEWAEAVTNVVPQDQMQKAFETVSAQFSEKEVLDLVYAIGSMNAFNRLAIAFHSVPAA